MNMHVEHEPREELHEAGSVSIESPTDDTVQPPVGWPIALQVALVFLVLTGATLTFAIAGGAGWLLALIPIGIEYVRYLRTDRCLLIDLLEDMSWNRAPGVPSRYAPGDTPPVGKSSSVAMRLRDLDVKGAFASTREDLVNRWGSTRDSIEHADGDHRAAALRTLVIVAGLMLAILHPATLLLSLLAATDWLLAQRRGVSVAGMLFDRASRSVRNATEQTEPAEQSASAPEATADHAVASDAGAPENADAAAIVEELDCESIAVESASSTSVNRSEEDVEPPPHDDGPSPNNWRTAA